MEYNDGKKAVHHDLDIKPVPAQVLYINEPDITGMFCGLGTIDSTGIDFLRKITTATTRPGMRSNHRITSACMCRWT